MLGSVQHEKRKSTCADTLRLVKKKRKRNTGSFNDANTIEGNAVLESGIYSLSPEQQSTRNADDVCRRKQLSPRIEEVLGCAMQELCCLSDSVGRARVLLLRRKTSENTFKEHRV